MLTGSLARAERDAARAINVNTPATKRGHQKGHRAAAARERAGDAWERRWTRRIGRMIPPQSSQTTMPADSKADSGTETPPSGSAPRARSAAQVLAPAGGRPA